MRFLPNVKILGKSKLKDNADDKIDVTQKMNFIVGRGENFVGKRENTGFHRLLWKGCQKSGLSDKQVFVSICEFSLSWT